MIKCCKDCKDRQVGCHAKCSRYLAEKAKADKINIIRKKEGYIDYLSCNSRRRGV